MKLIDRFIAAGLLALTAAAPAHAVPDPVSVVRAFYSAIDQGRCDEAVTLRTDYTREQCQTHPRGALVTAKPSAGSTRSAVVALELAYPPDRAQFNFDGFVTLTAQGEGWVIDGTSYRRNAGVPLPSGAPKPPGPAPAEGAPIGPGVVDDPVRGLIEPPPPRGAWQPDPASPPPPPGVESLDLRVDPGSAAPPPPAPMPPAALPEPPPSLPDPADSSPPQSPPADAPPPELLPPEPPPPFELLPEDAPYTPPVVGYSAGSAAILAACWTPEELRGRPGEKKIRRATVADHSPPERTQPLYSYPPLTPDYARSLRSIELPPGDKRIALTFDLCEQANDVTGYDGALVDVLRAEGVKATFYAGGKWMRSHPERAMQLIADPLFEIGNHGWTHGNMRVLRGREMQDQIHWTQAQYEILRDALLARPCARPYWRDSNFTIPELPGSFRYPYGTCSTESLRAVADAGLYPVQWSIVTGDPSAGQSAQAIVKGVLANLAPGAIVIAHANGRGWHTAEALRTMIPAIRKRGYGFATVTELIESGTPRLVDECYEVKPGDNRRYDKLFGKGTE